MIEGGPPESAGRPHEAVVNGSPRWMVADRAPRGAREQNPAYRPAHPLHPSDLPLGEDVTLRLAEADPATRTVRFELG